MDEILFAYKSHTTVYDRDTIGYTCFLAVDSGAYRFDRTCIAGAAFELYGVVGAAMEWIWRFFFRFFVAVGGDNSGCYPWG